MIRFHGVRGASVNFSFLFDTSLQQVAMLGQFPQVPLPQHPGEADVAADVMRQEQAAPGNADNDAVQMNAQGGTQTSA